MRWRPYFSGVQVHTPAVNPVVQALALTDVVVEAAVTALLLAFAIQAHKRFGTLDPHEAVNLKGLGFFFFERRRLDQLPVLSVVVPLLMAATISALGWLLRPRRRLLDTVGILTCAAVVAMLGPAV